MMCGKGGILEYHITRDAGILIRKVRKLSFLIRIFSKECF